MRGSFETREVSGFTSARVDSKGSGRTELFCGQHFTRVASVLGGTGAGGRG